MNQDNAMFMGGDRFSWIHFRNLKTIDVIVILIIGFTCQALVVSILKMDYHYNSN